MPAKFSKNILDLHKYNSQPDRALDLARQFIQSSGLEDMSYIRMEIWLSILKTFIRKSSFNNAITFAAQALLQDYSISIFLFVSKIDDVMTVITEEDHVKNELISTTLKLFNQNTMPKALQNQNFVIYLIRTFENTFSQTNKLLAI